MNCVLPSQCLTFNQPQAYQHIFTSPSSASNDSENTQGDTTSRQWDVATTLHLNGQVTPRSIAYAATQVSSLLHWIRMCFLTLSPKASFLIEYHTRVEASTCWLSLPLILLLYCWPFWRSWCRQRDRQGKDKWIAGMVEQVSFVLAHAYINVLTCRNLF